MINLNKLRRRADILFYALSSKVFVRDIKNRKKGANLLAHQNRCLRRYTLFEQKHAIRKILFTFQLKKK